MGNPLQPTVYLRLLTTTSRLMESICDFAIILARKCLLYEGLPRSAHVPKQGGFRVILCCLSLRSATKIRAPVTSRFHISVTWRACMDKRYSTIIFVPHARAKFRKL